MKRKLSTIIAFLQALLEANFGFQEAIDQLTLFRKKVRDGRLHDACIILIDDDGDKTQTIKLSTVIGLLNVLKHKPESNLQEAIDQLTLLEDDPESPKLLRIPLRPS
tara:strand:+ start:359 stop:679 length:321 start_codon:yes stop_codon:yes gene_type:complete